MYRLAVVQCINSLEIEGRSCEVEGSHEAIFKVGRGKRWLTDNLQLAMPAYTGRYIEPFLGGGAVYFSLSPERAIISDANIRLVETYEAIRANYRLVERYLRTYQKLHSTEFYYAERKKKRNSKFTRAAQFIYLNRTCWNGLYRENLKGEFNVPIGTKTKIVDPEDDFSAIAQTLRNAKILKCDFEFAFGLAQPGDLIFADPPYTTAHNKNGFIKYNQNIFSWKDQVRLKNCIEKCANRGIRVVLTNASHNSISDLYSSIGQPIEIERSSIISGSSAHRNRITESVYVF